MQDAIIKLSFGRLVKNNFVNIYTSNVAMVPSMYPASTNYSIDGVLFGNYLCIGNKSKIKIFGSKEHYGNKFQNQNHTAFENKRFVGSSENLLDSFLGSSGNSSDFGRF